jgi:hypothetical protein
MGLSLIIQIMLGAKYFFANIAHIMACSHLQCAGGCVLEDEKQLPIVEKIIEKKSRN